MDTVTPAPPVKKGFAFKGLAKKVEKAPEVFRDERKETDTKPSKVTSAVKAMFSKSAAVSAPKPKPKLKAIPVVKAPLNANRLKAAPVPTFVEPDADTTVIPGSTNLGVEEAETEEPTTTAKAKFVIKKKPLSGNLEEMKALIQGEEAKNPYDLPVPAYIPESRRGFSEFIKTTYDSFMLDATAAANPTPSGEKYPYQKFVREYMRNESPYRGLLTYHGLGSGKTCTAIAASEALYSTANKKIIVMTPASLRKNFLKEVSLCGFRHYRLKNFWTAMPASDAEARLFATSVLGVPESHLRTATSVWIPDFRKTADEANYSSLTADEQTEIRKQILAILVWDPVTNPTGRIRFINYNGISAQKLKDIACKKPVADFFDDAVIIIDEIHNVVRLMQGTIDPYLVKMKGLKRLMPHEEITVEKWNPSLCSSSKKYMRGYMFYRLLLDAKNSKIIGLSGTPIINFPEELGILMNVLHGYIPTVEGVVEQVGADAQQKINGIAVLHPHIDFVKATNDTVGGGTKVVLTLMPHGVRKTDGGAGVERMEEPVSVEDVMNSVRTAFETGGMKFRNVELKALPLLPPIGETFREKFISAAGNEIINNKIVLVKRLTGLVSYYKGSRADLMPRVKIDEIVRVPMSPFSQRGYIVAREAEVNLESKKKSSGGELGGVWGEVYEVGKGAKTNSYKMGSRQACNFIFPSGVLRPRPKSKKDRNMEAAAGNLGGDIVDTGREQDPPKDLDEDFPELDDGVDEEEAAAVREEDALEEEEMDMGADGEVGVETQAGGGDGDDENSENTGAGVGLKPAAAATNDSAADSDLNSPLTPLEPHVQPPYVPSPESNDEVADADAPAPAAPAPAQPLPPKSTAFKSALAAKKAAITGDCKAGQKPGEDYKQALERARECLRTVARTSLLLEGADGLQLHSPKYAEMLKRIAAAPGSSLVYSEFLDMEGIGIFRIAMDINGYCPIEISNSADGPVFSKRTIDSLKKGPGGQARYMTFSGNETADIRRLALDIFNGNFDELPENLKSILKDAGFINNHKGEIARVFCITSAGAEGLSLKCVRAVHIMEPYWNDVRLKQVKGRAIRIGSHLELPEKERNVSIYTYVSVFSEEVQLLKAGENRIDETIRRADGVDKNVAKLFKLPIPAGANQYVITTDERLYLIAERKKAITNALESTMKSAAVDCELNIQENRDGTFKCLPLKGKVGDFMYHPDLDVDIRESVSMYDIKENVPEKNSTATVAPDFIFQKLKDTVYRMRYIRNTDGDIIGFEMYAQGDVEYKKLLGTAGVKGEKPGPPVKWVKV